MAAGDTAGTFVGAVDTASGISVFTSPPGGSFSGPRHGVGHRRAHAPRDRPRSRGPDRFRLRLHRARELTRPGVGWLPSSRDALSVNVPISLPGLRGGARDGPLADRLPQHQPGWQAAAEPPSSRTDCTQDRSRPARRSRSARPRRTCPHCPVPPRRHRHCTRNWTSVSPAAPVWSSWRPWRTRTRPAPYTGRAAERFSAPRAVGGRLRRWPGRPTGDCPAGGDTPGPFAAE